MAALVGHGRNEGRRCRAGADDDHLLVPVVEVVRPCLGVHDLAVETIHSLPFRGVTPAVAVVPLAHPQEVAGEADLFAGIGAGDLERPTPVVGRPGGGGDGKKVTHEVIGGTVGLIIDGRGRPLGLPEDRQQCQMSMKTWVENMALYEEMEQAAVTA